MDSHITKIRSPTHNITIMALDVIWPFFCCFLKNFVIKIDVTGLLFLQASRGSVRLEEEITSLDRDLVLYVQVEEPNRPRLIFEVNMVRVTVICKM